MDFSLAGVWKFKMDKEQVGVSEKWFLDDFWFFTFLCDC